MVTRLLTAAVAISCLTLSAGLAAPARPAGDTPRAVSIETGRTREGPVRLVGRGSWQQLLVTGQFASGPERDLTRSASFQATPPGVVAVDATGLVTPLKDGQATILAQVAGLKASVQVQVANVAEDIPVSFANQVVPVFSKFGCNTGGCHGKADGQNGFKLSLFGFEPAEDYDYVVKEARGRRIFAAAPAHSLLVRKATGSIAHGGGKRLEPGSPFHQLLVRWIEQGTPRDGLADPAVQRIEVLPRERLLDRGSQQQLIVMAHLTDGSTQDVTRLAQFEPNFPEMAEVSPTGLVAVKQLPGSVAVMVRFQSLVDVARVTVPLGEAVPGLVAGKNFIDELVFKQLERLGLPPSASCDDATFIRRATIDLAGRIPTREETLQYLADRAPDKHEKLVDRLLASSDHADYFANKWSAILRNRRMGPTDDTQATFAFHAWIRASLHQNKPYDQFVREVLTAAGEEVKNPPVIWYREVKETTAQLEDVAQLFLGQRIACARCHHHPFEKWSQQDYYGMAAFFSQVAIKDPPPPKPVKKGQPTPPREPFLVSLKTTAPRTVNPKTSQPVLPAGLGGKALDIAPADDARHKLVDWMVDKDNPFFARMLANRYWKHFLGRGLVDPEDDLRMTNPPSNPELLDALAKQFTDSKYDLKKLIRAICTSQTYRLSTLPNAHNARDQQNYSRFVPRRLNAEVLLDAIDAVTGVKSTFKGVPAETRAVQLPDNQFESYFLTIFGRPDSASACECERGSGASLAQSLHLINSMEIQAKVANGRARQLASDKRPHEEKLRELYLISLSREPAGEEMTSMIGYITRKGNLPTAYEDIIWALINTKEFQFNH